MAEQPEYRLEVEHLSDTLADIAGRIEDLLDRPIPWTAEYLRTVLAEIAQTARRAIEEE